MKRALMLVAVLALAGCGSSHHAQPKPAPALSALLAREKSVHFVLDGTVKLDLNSILARLHPVPPFHVRAVGDASRLGLKMAGTVHGEVSGSGSGLWAGKRAYAEVGGTWYDLGGVKRPAKLLRGAQWTVSRGPGGRPRTLRGDLHLTTKQLEQVSGLSLPLGIDGADVSATIHLSRWGEPVTITSPGSSPPVCIAQHSCGEA